MTDEEIDKMADNFVNAQDFTKVYGVARKAECSAFWKHGYKRASREAEIKNKKLIREAHRAVIKSNEQLAEAREIITRFVWASSYFNEKETGLIEEAEQFLKESEK